MSIERIGIIRVSTKNQKENGNSLIEQKNKLKEYDNNIKILEFSQSAYSKSIFPHIIQHIKPNMEIVVVYADRLSRNIDDCTKFISEKLDPIKSYIYTLYENIKTNTKQGKLEFYKKIMEGQTLSHNLGVRVKDGLKHSTYKPKKYGDSKFEKENIFLILKLNNDIKEKNKINKIIEYLKTNNVKKNENDIIVNWKKGQINYIIKSYKNNEEYDSFSKRFNLTDLITELNEVDNLSSTKRKRDITINDENDNDNLNHCHDKFINKKIKVTNSDSDSDSNSDSILDNLYINIDIDY
jgi:DNA invertase Pin-like site-specific DNA recombinase